MSGALTDELTDAVHGGWRTAGSRFGPALVVLLACIGTTLLLTWLYSDAQTARAREQFAAWCEERQQLINRNLDSRIEGLYGLRALFDSSEYVSPDEFERYTSDAITRHRDVRSLGYLRYVADEQRDAFEQQYSRLLGKEFRILDLGPDGKPIPAARRPHYAPLVYGQIRDSVPIGLDSRTVPALVDAMDAAARNDLASVVILRAPHAAPEQTQRFVQVYLPIFSRGTRRAPADQRILEGFVRLRFVLEELTEGITDQARTAGIEMRVVEVGREDLAADIGEGAVVSESSWFGPMRLEWRGGIAIADRMLSLQLLAIDGRTEPELLPAWALLLAGLALSLAGSLAAYSLSRSRLRTEAMSRNLQAEMRERQRSEQRTAQSEERYRSLVENSPDAILMVRENVVTFVNRPAIELFGAASAEELVGRDVLDRVHPQDRAIFQKRFERMQQEGVVLPPLEERLLRLDGTTVHVEVRSVPFIIDGVMVLHVTIRDITARQQAERERIGLEAALRQAQRLEAIGTLTGGIAHDFNNILSSIVGNIRLVMEDLPVGHPARQSAHEIRNATSRARDLVKRLMTFSRQQEAPQSPLDLAPLIDEVQQLLRPALPAGVVLRPVVPPDTPPVIGDATQLHQVLVNLCTNAWQAMPLGRGEIQILVRTMTAAKARRESRATLQGAARYVCIEVRDNGSGIPREVIDRIFDPFFTTKGPSEGSGLGLAVVHGIVQSHQGAIVAKSEPGSGSSFFVYLRVSERAARPKGVPVGDGPRGANQHVLYIDDEESLVLLVTRILERNGYRCSATTDPRQALAWIDQNPQAYDLVLTDLNMPGMSGIDVARAILARCPTLPVVITTGYVRAADVAATRDLGIRDLILKPDTIDELANLVARFLQESAGPGS
ncbi:ATP-binding protein [Povalibacter sp.]|uniref:ATP-binding protein n=1 Tax=Povalibacter sp. TaxID=1962978 RepID=UPI002F3FDD7B